VASLKQRLSKAIQYIIPASLEGRLRWGSVMLVLVPSLLFIMFFAVYELANKRQEAYDRLEQTVNFRRDTLISWAKNKGVKFQMLAGTQNARNLDLAGMKIDFEAALEADEKFSDFIFVNRDGKVELAINYPLNIDVADSAYFQRALVGLPTLAEPGTSQVDGEWRLIFAAPVYGFKGEFQGAILGIMPIAAIDDVLGTMGFGKTGETYLMDNNGIRFTVPRFAKEENLDPSATVCYLKKDEMRGPPISSLTSSGITSYINCRDQQVIGVYYPIKELNWVIVGEIVESEILEPVYTLIVSMIVMFLCVLLVVLTLTVMLTNTIKRSLAYLLLGSESLKNRDYSYRINNDDIANAPKDLRQLCSTFNQMTAIVADRGNYLEEQISQRTEALKRAVNNLQQQIHFRRKTELLLLQNEEKYRMLFAAASDAILIAELCPDGTPGKFIEVNEKACELLGYSKNELLELTPYDIVANLRAGAKPVVLKLNSYQNTILEDSYIKKSGELVSVEVNVHKIPLNGRDVYFAIARDSTLRKKMEQEMARLERLNLIGEMAAGIGHEVRNPMTTVRGFLQLLGKRKENYDNAEYFKVMIEELDRANGIITEFLSLAKNKSVDLKMRSLNDIISAIYPLVKADGMLANQQIIVETGAIPELLLDEKEIRQLILNLVRNGLEAMPPKKRLKIKTYTEGDEVVLAVQDEGSGIPDELLAKLGTPFFTTKEKGTGLGLAVCYSIANRHKATIIPETGPKGTTFYVRFKTS
jgi:two-component system, sporulation sensor kinase E